LQIVKAGIFLDDLAITSPSELGKRIPHDAGAILLWVDEDIAIRVLVPYLLALPPGSALHLVVRGDTSGQPLRTISGAPLGDQRCASWLAASGAAIADLVHAAATTPTGDRDWFEKDGRVCGTSVTARLAALKDGKASVFVRSPGPEPRCHRLALGPDDRFVREGDGASRPELAFGYTLRDDALEVTGPIDRVKPTVAVVRCHAKYSLAGDDARAIQHTRVQRSGLRKVPRVEDLLYYSEQACLAAAVPADSAADCLRSVLDASSSLPAAVVDRLEPLIRQHRRAYPLRGGTCERFDFRPPPSKPGYNIAYQDSVAYNGSALNLHTVELGPQGTSYAVGVGSAEIYDWRLPVIQTNQDYVLVGPERWYLTEAACRAAAKQR
jgi:hypothetical protein